MRPVSRALRLALLAWAAAVIASCGGGGHSSLSSGGGGSGSGNVATLSVDSFPDAANNPQTKTNQAYVTITICIPGTSTCQSIDHVWVDTGSYGLRLFATSLTFPSQLPAVTSGTNPVANCIQFVSLNYMWGAVRTADVKIAGETASSVPIQVIGDASVPSTAPSACGGTATQTVAELGANGLLGIGLFQYDCGTACANSPPASPFYYACPSNMVANCQPVAVPLAQQLQNVVGLFPADNNGTLIQFPALAAPGQSVATGSLIFGINTQTNNQLGNAIVFSADPGNTVNSNPGGIQTTTTFSGGDNSEPGSFVDSGSNGWFFDNSTITQCSPFNGFYCPASPIGLSATMLPYNAPVNMVSHLFSFTIANVPNGDIASSQLGGPFSTTTPPCNNANPATLCTFDWGLPFFYGRSVFTAIANGGTTAGFTTPFIAATP